MGLDLTRRVGLAIGALIAMTLPAVADSCEKRQFEGKGYAVCTVEAADLVVQIPMGGGVDSLNVAAASAVAFWALRPQV